MSNRRSHFVPSLQTSIRRSLLAALGVCALALLLVSAVYTVHAEDQKVTETRDATGEDWPERPTNLQASASHDSVTLTWTASTDDTVTHYAVLRRDRKTDDGGVFKVIDSNAGPETSYTDDTVSPKGSYVYRVKAVNATGVSQWSSYASADIPAEADPADLAPSNLTALSATGPPPAVELAWDAPAEDSESVTGYEVLRAQGGGDLATLVADTGSADTSYTDAPATEAGETYNYVVVALRGEEKSRQSNLATVGFPPALPTGLTTSATHDAVTLTWDDPGDDSITHYEVYRRVTGQDSLGDFELIETDTGSAEAGYTDDDVSPETRYTYRVKAVNAHGASRWSGYSSVTTPEAPAPDSKQAKSELDPASLAPSGLSARAVFDDAVSAGVELSWDAPAVDAESVTGYEVLRAVGDGDLATLAADTGSADTSFADGAATEAGESYVYRVKAVRGQERSQASEEVRASVPQLASSGGNRSVVAAPQSVEVTKQQIWSATLTVGENSIFTGFSDGIDGSSLSDKTVTFNGVDYGIQIIAIRNSNGSLVFGFQKALSQGLINHWTVVSGGNEYQLADAHTPSSGTSRNKTYTWVNPSLSWSDGDQILVSLKAEQNVDASGTVVIVGKPHVGQTLTADTSGIEDLNGVPNRFAYQWKARDADIPGATGSTYTLQPADVGKTIKVEVSFTDDAGYGESLTSGAPPAVGEKIREVWTAKMTVGTGPSGSLGYHQTDYEGSSLTDTSFATSAGDHTVRQISIAGSEIRFTVTGEPPEAAEESWLLYLGNLQFPLANASKQVSVLVTAFSWSEPKPTWQSGDKVDVALVRTNSPAEGAPVIRGAPRVGDVLTVDTSDITDGNGIPEEGVFSYQWFRVTEDGSMEIPGATGASFPLDASHLGLRYLVKVSFTDDGGFVESFETAPTSAVGERAHRFWNATILVGASAQENVEGFGYSNQGFFTFSSITNGTVTYGSNAYYIELIGWFLLDSGSSLRIRFTNELPDDAVDDWVLDVRGQEFFLSEATASAQFPGRSFLWDNVELDWSDGDKVLLWLKVVNNRLAEGAPVILGAPRVDDVLTADTSGITDANGVPEDVVFSYQWFRGDTSQDISGATGASLLLDASHLGGTIGVKVSFTDGFGFEESVTSEVTAVKERAHKFWMSTLTATGSPDLEPLRVVGYPDPLFPGSSLSDPAVTYGPTSYSVEYIGLTGSDETSLAVRFSQAPSQGEIDAWILDVDGKEYFLSQATSQSTSDPDRTFTWESSGLSWSDGDVLSLALKVLNQPAEGIGITGEPGVGNTLSADITGITDPDGIPEGVAFTYQWVSFDGVEVRDIPGATGPSYTITRDREGDVLGVRVGFTDSRGFQETVTSGPVVSPQSGDLWVAALTVGRNAALNQNGFGEDFAGGALTDATFSHAGKDYTFSSISHDSNGALQLLLEPELTELDANLLDFYVRVHPFHFSNRSSSESSLNLNDSGQALIVWADAALIWSEGEVIRLALKAANQPAGGMPVIKGAPRVDDVLTADTSAITDGNGIPGDVVFSYQWFDGATLQDIPGATGATLPLDSSYLDLTIGVRVGFTDAEGYEESVTSEVTAPVEERAFKFWTSTLTATELPGSPIPNVGYPYPGSSLSEATVTFGAIAYSVESIRLTGSDETSLVVRFSQAPSQGEIDAWILDVDGTEYFLSQTTSQSTSDPDRTFIWESSGLSWSDGDVLSLALKVLNQPAEGRPGISGTRKFGETLTADTSGITDPNGIPEDVTFTYQWFSVDLGGAETDIPGATGPSYTIPRDREGDFLGVRVGFTDSLGFDESVTSEEVLWRRAGEIWAALMTVGQFPNSLNRFGYDDNFPGSSLSSRTFRFNETDHDIKRITLFRGSIAQQFKLNFDFLGGMTGDNADLLTLKVGEVMTGTTSFRFVDRDSSSVVGITKALQEIDWLDTGLTWSKGNRIRVALSAANQGAAGTAVLRGEAKVGRILTVDPSGITDPNGIPDDVVFTYQWVRCAGVPLSCEDIPGANGSSYQLTEADKDSRVGVRLSFHDTLGYLEQKSTNVVGPVEAQSSTVGQHFLDSTQLNPRGVWGNADTIWVANDTRVGGGADRIVAYNRSDLSRDSSKDFDPLHASNDFPFGIWSDGETMYVVESDVEKVYAYRMKDDPGTDGVDEFGARDPDKDILLSSQNGNPTGIWGNAGTIWVANDPTTASALDKIFAYTLVDDPATPAVEQYGARDSGKDLNGLNSAGNNDPRGIWSDGESMFVVNRKSALDGFITSVFAYRLSDGGRFSQRDIKLAEANGHPAGAWGDDGELWVVDDGVTSRSLFRYFLPYPATGQPTILGNLVVGQTLTADVSGIADRNGLPDAFDYQWYRSDGTNDTAIDGATGSSYLLTGSDLGGSIRVEVSFLDGHSYEETLFSDRTRPLNAPATGEPLPLETTRVLTASLIAGSFSTATGGFLAGYLGSASTLVGSLSPSTFTAEGTSYAVHQLYVSNMGELRLSLDKELDADFTLTLGDASFSSGAVSDSGQLGSSSLYFYEWDDSALSWSDGDVISVSLHEGVAAKFPQVGDTLLAGISDIDDRNGLPDVFAYQWLRYEGGQGTPISGATEGVYVLAPEDTRTPDRFPGLLHRR